MSLLETILAEVVGKSCTFEYAPDGFHALRKLGIGGSEVAAILGQSKYSSRRRVWLEKIGRKEPFQGNWFTERGKRREPAIRAGFPGYYEALTGKAIQLWDVTGWSFVSKEYPILRANLDGIVHHPDYGYGVLEIKTASSEAGWENNQVPNTYWYQVQHYMLVTGLDWCMVAAEIDGISGLEYRIVHADIGFQATWPDDAQMFWEEVQNDVDPGLAAENADGLAEIFPAAETATIKETPELQSLIQEYQLAKMAIKGQEENLDELKAKIEAAIGSDLGIRAGAYEVTWSNGKRSSVDTKALEAAHPDLAVQFKKETTYRTLRVKELKN